MFTIGQFSRLCCISARMLRHYDTIGLLHPYKQDTDTGYRYYDVSQLTTINKIEELKNYEFSLEEIKSFLKLGPQEQREQLLQKLIQLKAKKQHYEKVIQNMEASLDYKENINMNDYHVITMTQKAQNVLFIKRKINVSSEDFHKLAADTYQLLKEQAMTQTGPVQICYLDEEFSQEHANVEMQIEVSQEGPNTKIIPENLYVTVIHTGSMKELPQAYQAIMSWLSIHNEYDICGPSIERLLRDESSASGESELQTAVLFPICKKH